MGDAAEITRVARGSAQKIDRVFTEAVERLRIQVIRADQILTGAMEVIETTGSTIRSTVWGPIHQATAVIRGIKAGLEFFRSGKHPRNRHHSARRRTLYLKRVWIHLSRLSLSGVFRPILRFQPPPRTSFAGIERRRLDRA